MNLETQIQKERDQVRERVAQLELEKKNDQDMLQDLKDDYHAAIASGNTKAIDDIHLHIKEISERINRNREAISILKDENNPVIQKLIMDHVTKWKDDLNHLEKESSKLLEKWEPKQKELLEAVQQMVQMKMKGDRLRQCIKHYGENFLNQDNKKKVGTVVSFQNPIVKHIESLMIDAGVYHG